jgi:hypothetical protein
MGEGRSDDAGHDGDLDLQMAIEDDFRRLVAELLARGHDEAALARALAGLAEANRAMVAGEEPE